MEKNGNTLAPGDPVVIRGGNTKLASAGTVTLETIDTDNGLAQIKLASGETTWVDLSELERA